MSPLQPQVGDLVVIRGGFENGLRGTIVRNEPTEERPARFVVQVKGYGPEGDHLLGGLAPHRLDVARPCPYCGRGPCRGSALTANGRDVDRFARIHPERGVPERFPS